MTSISIRLKSPPLAQRLIDAAWMPVETIVEANPPLVIDADAVLALPVALGLPAGCREARTGVLSPRRRENYQSHARSKMRLAKRLDYQLIIFKPSIAKFLMAASFVTRVAPRASA
jgi:hypothetical protein